MSRAFAPIGCREVSEEERPTRVQLQRRRRHGLGVDGDDEGLVRTPHRVPRKLLTCRVLQSPFAVPERRTPRRGRARAAVGISAFRDVVREQEAQRRRPRGIQRVCKSQGSSNATWYGFSRKRFSKAAPSGSPLPAPRRSVERHTGPEGARRAGVPRSSALRDGTNKAHLLSKIASSALDPAPRGALDSTARHSKEPSPVAATRRRFPNLFGFRPSSPFRDDRPYVLISASNGDCGPMTRRSAWPRMFLLRIWRFCCATAANLDAAVASAVHGVPGRAALARPDSAPVSFPFGRSLLFWPLPPPIFLEVNPRRRGRWRRASGRPPASTAAPVMNDCALRGINLGSL
ncbi:uncharacterized protein LOC127593571 [Hippocampus zosterae]|uniref:uncharacterized protein LOC127593571 n=1 Tax=Hippocampus zosterae TaxID=109293 RepID=UPI00223D965E|nr:uncharacterized protein LOC127593571 [Hippocampus zosterae]